MSDPISEHADSLNQLEAHAAAAGLTLAQILQLLTALTPTILQVLPVLSGVLGGTKAPVATAPTKGS